MGSCTFNILMLVMWKRRNKDVHIVGDEDDDEENYDVDDHDEGG